MTNLQSSIVGLSGKKCPLTGANRDNLLRGITRLWIEEVGMPSRNLKNSGVDAATQCLSLVQQAVASALLAQHELMGLDHSDFDRMAILAATEHLERALAELQCFDPERENLSLE